MRRGGKRAGAGRKPKAAIGLTEVDIIRVLRSPRSIEKLFDLRLKKFELTRGQYEAMLSVQKGRVLFVKSLSVAGGLSTTAT
jgi:hypothetical protein